MSTRQRRIVELLFNQQNEITAADIAAEIGTSTRTIHRELIDIEPALASHGIILHKKSGIGIKIEADNEQIELFKQELNLTVPAEYSTEERKVLILCMLLQYGEPVKLFTLAHELNVTMPTISNDLDQLEQQINDQQLTLIRKRGYGVELSGNEQAKRQMISFLAIKYLDDSDLFEQKHDKLDQNVVHPLTNQLLLMVGKEQFFKLERALWQLNKQWPTRLSEAAYTRLLIRLSVAFTRIQQGCIINPKSDVKHTTSADQTSGKDNSQLVRLLELLDLQLPQEEEAYIDSLLKDEGQHELGLLINHNDMSLIETVTELIRFIESKTQISFMDDRSLVEGLIQHMHPAFQRISSGLAIRNPILTQIKKDYDQLYSLVRQGVDEFVQDIHVPDEEVGYIVMHFGAAIERLKQIPWKVRAVLVCTSGIGSSKLLAVRISKELPQIELIGHLSWYEAVRLPTDEYDLIISTVNLPLESDKYIKISPLLTEDETDKLRSFIHGITLKNMEPSPVHVAESDPGPLDRLRQLHIYSDIVLRLLDGFKVHTMELASGGPDLESQLLHMMSSIDQPSILLNKEKIVKQLLIREQQGSLIMPDTEIALMHTRSEWVQQPVISLFRYDMPLKLNHEAGAVKQILLMLGPMQLEKASLELLSEISGMLLLTEMITLLEGGSKEEIRSFISRQLEKYMIRKLDWRD
ncbi:BglG family transcription antiterminator [Paenibacillus lentus]|uniref:PRD domain-containing protein n=1 Tax=Paenibacillus lentus TaxID=1338368 RepID=A0A3Q8SCM9_9BACL|nr:PRD domain-containing protein [Paenibacillus lentus]AZK47610.1 PRD domain-containing protein [Paenibacillus lentus]